MRIAAKPGTEAFSECVCPLCWLSEAFIRRVQVKTRILLILAFLTPLAGWAVDPVPMDVKLGLWETTLTNQTDMSSMLPPEVLARMSPEQRAKMEAAMSGRGGARTTTKRCVTKDTINEALASANTDNMKQMNCTRTFVTSTSTKQVVHMECTSGNHEDQRRRSG